VRDGRGCREHSDCDRCKVLEEMFHSILLWLMAQHGA